MDTATDINPRATMGGNKPPIEKPAKPIDIHADLDERYPQIDARAKELTATAETVPSVIGDDDTCGKAQELVKQIRVHVSTCKATRKIEKEPYDDGGKAISGWFGKRFEVLDGDLKDKVTGRIDAYLKKKEDEERIRREEEARKAREESERKLKEAQEAEQRRIEAEAAAERARQEEERAKAEKERQLKEAREAEERARVAREQEKIAEAARKEREAREAREALERKAAEARQKEIDEAAAAKRAEEEAERKRKAEEARAAEQTRIDALRKEREAEERKAEEARAAATEERRKQREAEEARQVASSEAKDASKDERTAFKAAERHDKQAVRHDIAAQGSAADLARTRSEYGTVGTLAERMTYRIVDFDKIPLERLRPYLNPDAIEAAVFRFMQSGQRDLPGVVFEKAKEARVA